MYGMKAWDYDAVISHASGEVYCVTCLPEGVSVEDEEIQPIFALDEVDEYPVCTECGEVHEYMTKLERDE